MNALAGIRSVDPLLVRVDRFQIALLRAARTPLVIVAHRADSAP